ncbi:MAG: hypothetical protein JSS96_02270 [Bacteroidetes bacterium]|nr:hypothetical protein [Bacteroidota bacterium]
MKHLTYLFIAVSVLSLAACKKSNDTNPIRYGYSSNVYTYKGNMNDDQIALIPSNSNATVTLKYKGISFSATSVSFTSGQQMAIYHLSIATNGQIIAYGDLHVPALYFANGSLLPAPVSSYIGLYITAPSFITFAPGSIFESGKYTLAAN